MRSQNPERLAERGEGGVKAQRITRVALEPVVLVESGHRGVFRIDKHHMEGNLGPAGAGGRIGEQGRPELLPLKPKINRQTPQPHCGNGWILWQLSLPIIGNVIQIHMTGGQGVISGDGPRCPIDRDETGGHPALYVLICLPLQVGVEGGASTGKGAAVLIRQGHD